MKTTEEATALARNIKETGVMFAKTAVMASGNLAVAALTLRSAVAELEFNMQVQGMDVAAYEELKGILEKTLNTAMAKSLTAVETTSSGGDA
jgi:hypothetical protein